jgi:hypothetical protein
VAHVEGDVLIEKDILFKGDVAFEEDLPMEGSVPVEDVPDKENKYVAMSSKEMKRNYALVIEDLQRKISTLKVRSSAEYLISVAY